MADRIARFSKEHGRFLIVDEVIGPAVVNFALNAGIGWYLFRNVTSLPMWGLESIAADTAGTAFFLPLLTAAIAWWLIPPRVRKGTLLPIPPELLHPTPLSRRPRFVRALVLSAGSMLFVAVPLLGVMALAGVHQMPRGDFIWYKGSFAAGLGVLVTPALGWWALMDASLRYSRIDSSTSSANGGDK